jgi:L-rhamnonate dehydratase
MKIKEIKAYYPKWENLAKGQWQSHFWQIVVKIKTDNGLIGYGYGGGGEPSVLIINKHFKELLIGKNIDTINDIQDIWNELYFKSLPYGRHGLAIMAISGVDLCLWDLLGKQNKKPVYELIGPVKKRIINAYATGNEIKSYLLEGFKDFKIPHKWENNDSYESLIKLCEEIRSDIGPDGKLMIDSYMSWNSDVCLKMDALLKKFNISWFEDINTPDDLEELSKLRNRIDTKIAGGEHDMTLKNFIDISKLNSLDIWQPDITWCGGLTAGIKIIKLAEQMKTEVVLNRGGEVWGLHLIKSSCCENLAEIVKINEKENNKLWNNIPKVTDGLINPNDNPGFGVELNEHLIK